MVKTYGSIHLEKVKPSSSRRSTLNRAVNLGLIAVAAVAVVITLVAISKTSSLVAGNALMQTNYDSKEDRTSDYLRSAQETSLSEAETQATINGPTEGNAEAFKKDGDSALSRIGVADATKTDLPDSCGLSMYACANKILTCTESRLVKTEKGEITPLTSACNCFVRGATESIPIPGQNNVVFTCPYNCVADLISLTSKFLSDANGPNGVNLNCDLSDISNSAFGNNNKYVPTATDTDPLVSVPIDDPLVERAAEALRINFNSARLATCPATQPYSTPGTIKYAKKGMSADGKSQYRLELVFGSDVVFARIAHLPEDHQVIDPNTQAQLDDPGNLNGRFVLMSSTPGPCDDAVGEQIAVSETGSDEVNKQNLGWTSTLKAEHEGMRVKDFGMGDVPLSDEERKAFYVELDTTDFNPPAAYDARDVYATQQPCKAFGALNQGGCGSCYAFAAASAYSARMCRFNPSSLGNIVASPQQFIDCANGCDGGNSLSVYQTLVATPTVESWCDPYTGSKQACNSVCAKGNKVTGQPGSVRTVGGAGPNGVLQMQLELVRGGPGVVSLMVVNDFFGYSSGVYTPSATATQVGGHAVSLVGWGVDSAAGPYWIVQNSWGGGWGEGGYFRIVRGQDTCTIESRSGLAVVKPLAPTACPNAKCANGAATLADCSCQCDGIAKSGPTCSDCALKCQNGGVMDAACTQCSCPLGFFGPMCEGGYTLSAQASCIGDGTSVTVTYAFGGATAPPTQTSFAGFFAPTEYGPFKSAASGAVCGAVYRSYSATVNGGLCPKTGTFKLSPPAKAGQYKVVVAPFSPPDANGISGFYPISDGNIIGLYTVLPAGCAAADKAIAVATNSPAAILSSKLSAAATAKAAQLAAMKARLDAVQPLLSKLTSELPPALTITGADPSNPIVWGGGVQQICYRIPASANVNPKNLVLYVGDGSGGSYYPNALGASGNAPLPADYQGCTKFSASGGVPAGQLYTIMLQDASTGNAFTGVSFTLYKATVAWTGLLPAATQFLLTVAWNMPAALASPKDTVSVYNSAGAVVYWFYTSCKCQTAPAAAAVAAPAGSLTFKILKKGSVPGGYTMQLSPAGSNVVAAVALNWIPWVKFGW